MGVSGNSAILCPTGFVKWPLEILIRTRMQQTLRPELLRQTKDPMLLSLTMMGVAKVKMKPLP